MVKFCQIWSHWCRSRMTLSSHWGTTRRRPSDFGWMYCLLREHSFFVLFKNKFYRKNFRLQVRSKRTTSWARGTDGPLCHGECQFSIFWFTPPSLRAFFCLLFETNISGKKCCFSNHKQGQVEREIFKRWRSISKANLNDWRNIWKKQQIKRALHRFESAMFRRDIFVFVFLVIIMKRQ